MVEVNEKLIAPCGFTAVGVHTTSSERRSLSARVVGLGKSVVLGIVQRAEISGFVLIVLNFHVKDFMR